MLEGLTVIDMSGAAPRPETSILIRDGRIVALYRSGSRRAPAGARTMDLRGHYAIPGLIDAHIHLTSPFIRTEQQDSLAEFFLRGGITALRDMAGNGAVLRERARKADSGASLSPRIFYSTLVAGPDFFASERRAADLAPTGTPGKLPWMRSVGSEEDAALAATGAKEIGATGIKIYAELTPALTQVVSREAHARGLKVWSHAAIVPAKPDEGVAAGVDALSHAQMLVFENVDPMPVTYAAAMGHRSYGQAPDTLVLNRLFRTMRDRGTLLDATLFVARRLENSSAVREGRLINLQGIGPWAFEATRLAHRAGVKLVAGTDVSGYPGRDQLPTIHDELAIYVEDIGLTPLEALMTATRNGAELLGARDLGVIAPGKRADLVILAADPLADIRNTRRLTHVVKGGVVLIR